jgi:ParB-like chromosome segregation protein Spo0J
MAAKRVLQPLFQGNSIMRIALRDLSTIKPYGKNPRRNDPAVDAVAASIKEFGFRQPIVVDDNNEIIVGHTRYKAALKLGLKRVPVHVAHGLTAAQVKAYRIADNQTGSLSQWNEDLLPIELAELQGMNFDLNLTGFTSEDLLRLLEPATPEGLSSRAEGRGTVFLAGDHLGQGAPRPNPQGLHGQS